MSQSNDEMNYWKLKFNFIFNFLIIQIKAKFLKAGFPHKVIESTINNFNNVDEELLIPRWLFVDRKTVAINLPFSNKNEHFSKKFCEKLELYANGKVKFNIIWARGKLSHYSKLKIKLNILAVLYIKEFVVVVIIT